MSGSRKNIAAGTQLAAYGLWNNSGLFSGSTTSLAQGAAGSPLKRLLGLKRANPGVGEPQNVNITGDDIVLGSIEFGPNEVPSFIIESSVFDLDIQADLQGTAVEELDDIRLGAGQPENPNYPDAVIILQGKAKKQDVGVKGIKAWVGDIIPVASIVPLLRSEYGERAAAVDRYKVTAQVATKKPWNVTIAEADLGTTGLTRLPFTSDNPISMHAFEGDGVVTAFGPLDFTPVSQAKVTVHEGNGQKLVAGTDFTVDTATKMITRVAGALPEGTRWNVLYEIQP